MKKLITILLAVSMFTAHSQSNQTNTQLLNNIAYDLEQSADVKRIGLACLGVGMGLYYLGTTDNNVNMKKAGIGLSLLYIPFSIGATIKLENAGKKMKAIKFD